MRKITKEVRRSLYRLVPKAFNLFVIFALVVQPVGAPGLFGIFASSERATAADTEPAADTAAAPAEEKAEAPAEKALPKESEPAKAEPAAKQEEPTDSGDKAEVAPAPTEEDSTPDTTKDEPAAPAEEVVETPAVTPAEVSGDTAQESQESDAPAVTPAEDTENTVETSQEPEVVTPTPVEEPGDGTVAAPEGVLETPQDISVADAEGDLNGQVCVSASGTESPADDWKVDGDKAETKGVVKPGVTYVFPLDKGVRVTFTCLPKDESKRAPLSIERIKISDLRLPAGTVAVSEYAYDITTDGMGNGTFKYDLSLPKFEGFEDVDISYIEMSVDEAKGMKLKKSDLGRVERDAVDTNEKSVEASDIDHFTIVFPTINVVCQNDVNGVNDVSGQKDLTMMCRNTDVATNIFTKWNWDDISWSGNNTGDACNLFDTDGDGNVNYAVCVTIGKNPAVIQSTTRYSCGDDKPDRCTSPATSLSLSPNTTCEVNTSATDPFSGGNAYPNDTQAVCNISLADVGGSTSAKLIDVCSYPSAEPNSAPSDCIVATQAQTGKLEIVKSLVPSNDSGRFNLSVDGSVLTSNVGNGGTTGEQVVLAGNHTFNEAGNGTTLGDYTTSVSCKDNNGAGSVVATTGSFPWTISVAKDKDIVCTITNTRINNGSITIVKDAVPNDPQDFSFYGSFGFTLDDDPNSATPNSQTFSNLAAGSYSVSETPVSGWTQTSATCSDGSPVNNISLSDGENVTCTFTNIKQATLTLVKTVTNDNGGTKVAADFQGKIDGGSVAWGQVIVVASGAHTASETNLSGYITGSWGGDCAADGSVTLAAGENKTCTITNDDQAGTLIVKKVVKNDNGGNATASDFSFKVNGGSSMAFEADGQNDITVNAGTYSVVENAADGYAVSYDNCSSVVISNGGTATCTITNDDIVPSITLTKKVVNDNGGQAGPDDFGISIDGTAVVSGQKHEVAANVPIVIDEAGLAGYSFVSITGDAKCPVVLGGTVTLEEGENISCTITNDDRAASLTVKKHVVNDNGGTKTAADFTMNVTGGHVSDLSFVGSEDGATVTLDAGSYSADEVSMTGYAKTLGTDCSGTIALGEHKTCTITNDDIQPKLTVIKIVTNDNGGDLGSDDFTMRVFGENASPESFPGDEQGTAVALDAGEYSVTEDAVDGYVPQYSDDCRGSIAVGEEKTCTITNEDQAPTLTLVKTVVNDNGGTLGVSDFPLFVDDIAVTSGVPVTLKANQEYTASETEQYGYAAGAWGGACSSDGKITLKPGEHKTCTLTNNDIQPKLTVTKVVVNDGLGGLKVSDFPLFVSQMGVTSGVTNGFNAGTYTVSETNQPGYTGTISGDCAENGSVTLAAGDVKSCTITNNDGFGKIIVEKQTLPDGSTQSFPFNPSWSQSGFSLSDGQQHEVTLPAGTYSVAENAPAGWDLTSAVCSDQRSVDAIVLGDNETVTCVFTNTERGSVTIVKDAINNNAQDFTFHDDFGNDNPGMFLLDDDSNATLPNSRTFEVEPGTYSVTEDAVPGWQQEGVSCSDQSLASAINVAPGEHVTCTFTNEQYAKIVLVKNTVGGDDTFGFSATGDGLPASISLMTSGGTASQTFADLDQDNTYSIAENVPGGWDLSSATCTGGNTPAHIAPDPNETVTCTFTNIKKGHLIVEKTTLPAGDKEVFHVTASGTGTITDGGNGVVKDDQDKDYEVTPGTYSVAETVPDGWDQTGNTCQNVSVAAGETKRCKLTNTKRGTIVIEKDTIGGDGEFEFQTSWNEGGITLETEDGTAVSEPSQDLVPGTGYSVSEDVPEGWVLSSASCDHGTIDAIEVLPGETTTCVFTDTKSGHIIIDKVTDPRESEQSFDFATTGEGYESFSLTDVAAPNDQLLPPGAYTVAETAAEGWNLTGLRCSSQGPTPPETENNNLCHKTASEAHPWNAISVPINNYVHDGHEMDYLYEGPVDKNGHPQGGGVGEKWCADNAPSEDEDNNVIYSVAAVVPNDSVGDVTTDLENGSASIELAAGETVRCTFTNTFVAPTLVIEKTNNAGSAKKPGDTVTYTIHVTAPESNHSTVKSVKVTDLPPKGFGSIVASALSVDKLTKAYASPGEWTLGDMAPGDELSVSYEATIGSDQDAGTYKDLAWAGGSSLLGAQVLAVAGTDGNLGDPNYVGTKVAVELPANPSDVALNVRTERHVDTKTVHKVKRVLGAATVLPATGGGAGSGALALVFLVLGVWLRTLSRRKSLSMPLMSGLVAGLACFLAVSPASAASPVVKIETPETPVAIAAVKIGFVTLDIDGRALEAACHQVSGPDTAAVVTSYEVKDGGNSGNCEVTLPADGTYTFNVSVSEGEGGTLATSDIVSVELVSGTPSTPLSYSRSSCVISFTTADDGLTSAVELYRSSSPSFTADSSTFVTDVAIGPNTAGTITDPNADCGSGYYYAIRSVAASGAASDFTGDERVTVDNEHKKRTKTTTKKVASPAVTGAIAVSGTGNAATEGQVEGAATEENGNGDMSGKDGSVLGESTMLGDASSWMGEHPWRTGFGILILIGIIAYVYREWRDRKSKQ